MALEAIDVFDYVQRKISIVHFVLFKLSMALPSSNRNVYKVESAAL